MPPRPLIALTAALALAGTSLTAATAAPSNGKAARSREAPVARVQLDGVASGWDAAEGVVSLDDADVHGGPKALRRAVRRGATVTLRITPTTRVVVEDEDGSRSRVSAADLFDELDPAADEVELEATARVPRSVRPAGGEVVVSAARVVAYLPPAAEDDPGAGSGDDEPSWDDGGDLPDDPAADPGADDPPLG